MDEWVNKMQLHTTKYSKKKEENSMLQHGCHAFIDPENGMVVAQGWRKRGRGLESSCLIGTIIRKEEKIL